MIGDPVATVLWLYNLHENKVRVQKQKLKNTVAYPNKHFLRITKRTLPVGCTQEESRDPVEKNAEQKSRTHDAQPCEERSDWGRSVAPHLKKDQGFFCITPVHRAFLFLTDKKMNNMRKLHLTQPFEKIAPSQSWALTKKEKHQSFLLSHISGQRNAWNCLDLFSLKLWQQFIMYVVYRFVCQKFENHMGKTWGDFRDHYLEIEA